MRARARAARVFMRAGAGERFLPSDGSLFRALHAHVHTHTRTPTSASTNEKNVHAAVRTRVCVYVASLECVPGV